MTAPRHDYSPDAELLDRLERVRVLLSHALKVRRAIASGASEGRETERAFERFLHDNVEPGFVPRSEDVEAALATVDQRVAERTGDRETRFLRLVRLLDLTRLETDLLLCALAPAVRRGFRETMLIVGPELSPGVHPAAHLIEVVAASAESYARARAALEPESRLVRRGALVAQAAAPLSPVLWQAVAPSQVSRRWLMGGHSPYPRLDQEPPLRRSVDSELAAELDAIASTAKAGDHPHVLLAGESGAGRTRAAAALAARLGCAAISLPPDPAELRPAILDAQLRANLLFVDLEETRADADMARTLAAAPVPVAVRARTGSEASAMLLHAGFAGLEARTPGLETQVDAWRTALGNRLDSDAAADLVRGHTLELGAIEEAAAQVRARCGDDAEPAVLLAAAEQAARQFTTNKLAQVADRLSTTLTWDDLVLPEETRAAVDEIWRAAAARHRVFEEWGFEARTPYGRAISALFAGEPGTGKTMVATLVARALGIELYRVDLSRLVDKYIGETEKHLATLFAEAERGRCVLLFDEADALFGKRTKTGESATERYANLEVNYLLQRIETFSGIVLLTTNQESIIDEAFKRRIRYRVEFPFPSEEERAEMWRRLIPAQAPLAEDFAPESLARRYEIAGGHIKSAVLRAAFAAAAAGEAITQQRLIHAADQELEAIGKLVVGRDV